jgi:preprotein translocase subunit YajC
MRLVDLFVNVAHANNEAAAVPPNAGLFQVVLLGGMFVMFYFFLIRPQKKRQQEQENMLKNLNQNDEVATHAGILGKIKKIQDNYVVLKVSESVELKFQKSAISVILPKGTIKTIQ